MTKDIGVEQDERVFARIAARKKPAQKPVAWIAEFENGEQELHFEKPTVGETITPLYTTPPAAQPPQRPWVGLTDENFEATFLKCGGKWNGDQWVIEDADFHPFLRTIMGAKP
jgi:hypothetical protein